MKKDLYASVGLILKELQYCELLMTQALFIIKGEKGKIKSIENKSEHYRRKLKDTFAQLVNQLLEDKSKEALGISDELIDQLKKTKDLRNYYAHSFFKEFTDLTKINLHELIEGNKFFYGKIYALNNDLIEKICVKSKYEDIADRLAIEREDINEIMKNS